MNPKDIRKLNENVINAQARVQRATLSKRLAESDLVAAQAALEAALQAPKKRFHVVMRDGGSNKLQAIKAVRDITGLGLKEAKDVVDCAGNGRPFLRDLDEDTAKKMLEKIAASGAFAGIETVA